MMELPPFERYKNCCKRLKECEGDPTRSGLADLLRGKLEKIIKENPEVKAEVRNERIECILDD